MSRPLPARGFSIVEVVVTIVILSIALLGIVSIVRMGTQESADIMLETRAIALGQAYLDEIMGRRFDELSDRSGLSPCFDLLSANPAAPRPCTEPGSFGADTGEPGIGTDRDKWDDVDDYHGWDAGDGAVSGELITDAEGNTREGYANYLVAVDVTYAGTEDAWGPLTDTHAKLVTLTVSYRGQDPGWKFSSFKGNY